LQKNNDDVKVFLINKGTFMELRIIPLYFFRENAEALHFDALIEKEGYMYKSKKGLTPRHTTQPKRPNLGE
jgi:hypothetical protein